MHRNGTFEVSRFFKYFKDPVCGQRIIAGVTGKGPPWPYCPCVLTRGIVSNSIKLDVTLTHSNPALGVSALRLLAHPLSTAEQMRGAELMRAPS